MHMECGFGGLTGQRLEPWEERDLQDTSDVLPASSQKDHRTVLHTWTQPRGLERTAPEKGCVVQEAWPESSPRDPAGGAASAAALLPALSRATQAGGSQAPRCFGIRGNSSGMRWCTGGQAPPGGLESLEGSEGTVF